MHNYSSNMTNLLIFLKNYIIYEMASQLMHNLQLWIRLIVKY